MKLLELFMNHSHYWGVPHTRIIDNRLVQTCYGCSKDREVKIALRPHRKSLESSPADVVVAWNPRGVWAA